MALGCTRDVGLLFAARVARMLSYGALATVLLRLLSLLMTDAHVGTLLLGIVIGDLVITLLLTSRADRFGRRRTLQIGAALKLLSGLAFGLSSSFPVLLVAGILGVISPTGGEIGPFLAIEQACVADAATAHLDEGRDKGAAAAAIARIFGWYNAVGYAALALGGVAGGVIVAVAQERGATPLESYRDILFLYAALGAAKLLLYTALSRGVEVAAPPQVAAAAPAAAVGFWRRVRAAAASAATLGLRRPESRSVVAALCALFAVDAFAGGFVMQTWLVLWFARRWGTGDGALGGLLAASNVAAGLSGAGAGYLVQRFGAVETMVFTHLPSNLLLMAVPLMPTAPLAAAMLVARFTISQMDVPARQAYVASVVTPDERSAAGGLTNIVRSVGLALAPLPLAALTAASPDSASFSAPFFIAGALKCAYDLTLYAAFVVAARRRARAEALVSSSSSTVAAAAAAAAPTAGAAAGGGAAAPTRATGAVEVELQPLVDDGAGAGHPAVAAPPTGRGKEYVVPPEDEGPEGESGRLLGEAAPAR